MNHVRQSEFGACTACGALDDGECGRPAYSTTGVFSPNCTAHVELRDGRALTSMPGNVVYEGTITLSVQAHGKLVQQIVQLDPELAAALARYAKDSQ